MGIQRKVFEHTGSGEDTVPVPFMPERIKMHFSVISHILYPVKLLDMSKAAVAGLWQISSTVQKNNCRVVMLNKKGKKK